MANSSIEKRINGAVKNTFKEMKQENSELGRATENNSEIYVVTNSSFLYRDKSHIKTNQSPKRLVSKIASANKSISLVGVTESVSIKSHFKIHKSSEELKTKTLKEEISRELQSLGDVLFVLLGTIKGIRDCAESVSTQLVKELRLTTKAKQDITLSEDGNCCIHKIMPVEDLLTAIRGQLKNEQQLSDQDCQNIAKSYDKLIESAVTEVQLSKTGKISKETTIIGKIEASILDQIKQYDDAIRKLHKDHSNTQALNDVLRIAYNFSTDVLPIVFLLVSICDVKPIVFWCTIDKHWRLYKAFAALPWAALGRKASLEAYRDIIAAARNSAFHHILPFDTTIEIDLSRVNVAAETMRLFLPYGQKQNRGVRLKDQELVDIFADFSRAKQRPVSTAFWQGNLDVMNAVSALTSETLDTLIALRTAK